MAACSGSQALLGNPVWEAQLPEPTSRTSASRACQTAFPSGAWERELKSRVGRATALSLPDSHIANMKFTQYFQAMRVRPDRKNIQIEWIERAIANPIKETVQQDGRIRRWVAIEEADGKYLRVIFLDDGETVHSAFFDRSFRP